MALPRVASPTYEMTVPSTGQKVKYRPFLVKEEKTLLMAMEAGDNKAMSRAMQDIIVACTEGAVDLKTLASFVGMCVCVPTTRVALPSKKYPIAFFSLVISP